MADSSLIRSTCPHYGKGIGIRPNQVGRRLRCPACRMSFTFQTSNPEPSSTPDETQQTSPPTDSYQPAADANELVFTPDMAPPPPRSWPKAKMSASFPRAQDVVFQAAIQAIRSCKCDLVAIDHANHHLRFSIDPGNGGVSLHDLFAFDTAGSAEIDLTSHDPNENYHFDAFYQAIIREMGKYLMFVAEPPAAKVSSEPLPPRRRSTGYREHDLAYRRRSRRQSDQLISSIVIWSLVAGAFGVLAGLFFSQYLPVFGDWLSIHLAEPLSPARLHYVPIHCLVFGFIGAMGGAGMAAVIHHTGSGSG